jgi:hypothetical protein
MSDTRLDVRKTYKLLINGAFPRSESGRSYEVASAKGAFLANVAQGSRKDARRRPSGGVRLPITGVRSFTASPKWLSRVETN